MRAITAPHRASLPQRLSALMGPGAARERHRACYALLVPTAHSLAKSSPQPPARPARLAATPMVRLPFLQAFVKVVVLQATIASRAARSRMQRSVRLALGATLVNPLSNASPASLDASVALEL